MSGTPLFSLVTRVGGTTPAGLAETAASVLGQRLPDWEWLVEAPEPPGELVDLARDEPRVRVVPDAFGAAGGEFVVLVRPGDQLEPRALRRLAGAREDDVDLLYADLGLPDDEDGRPVSYRRPDFSPERLRHHPYALHLAVLRRTLVEQVGGLRAELGPAAEHDLLLRVSERARAVVHVPAVLSRAAETDPGADPAAWDPGVRAVQEHLDRVGIAATAERGPSPGRFRVRREPDLTTPVSVVIPTIGSGGLVWGRRRRMVVDAVRSVRERSRHQDLEFVVVYDPPTPPEVLADLRALPGVRLTLVEFTEPFNFSAKCNVGALHATGEVLVFLNDDVEAESDGLVEQLVAPLREDGVGATGAKLLFPSMRIQHAGVEYGSGRITHSYYRRAHPGVSGTYDDLWINREATALTGACIAVRREVFAEVGGFSEQLPVNYNDVDLCLKIARSGRRLLWLHDVVLFHFESVSRSPDTSAWEKDFVKHRWGDYAVVRERLSNDVG